MCWEAEQHPANFRTGQLTDSGTEHDHFFCAIYYSLEIVGIFYQMHTFQLCELKTLSVLFCSRTMRTPFYPGCTQLLRNYSPVLNKFHCDCSSVSKLVIPQAQPSSSHLLPSFLYPPTSSLHPPPGGSHMLQACSVPSG